MTDGVPKDPQSLPGCRIDGPRGLCYRTGRRGDLPGFRHLPPQRDGKDVSANTASATGLAGRYAAALFDLTEAEGSTDRVADDLKGLVQLIDADSELKRALSSPTVNRDERLATIAALGEKSGMQAVTIRFLSVLARHTRLSSLASVTEVFDALLAEKRGEVTVEVFSAVPLVDDQADAVASAVAEKVGSKVTLLRRVDPSLLGGLVIRVGSRMIDASLKTKLRHLELAMRGAG